MLHRNRILVFAAAAAVAVSSCATTDLVAPEQHPANPNASAGPAPVLPPTLAQGFDPHQAYEEPAAVVDPHAHHRMGGMPAPQSSEAPLPRDPAASPTNDPPEAP